MVKVNKSLAWESEIKNPDWSSWSEADKKWYAEKVLTWGSRADVLDLGLDTIKTYLPELRLPKHIREYWESYFKEEDRNGNTYRTAEKSYRTDS